MADEDLRHAFGAFTDFCGNFLEEDKAFTIEFRAPASGIQSVVFHYNPPAVEEEPP